MPSRKFDAKWLKANVIQRYDKDERGGVKVLARVEGDSSRWHQHITNIFSFEGKTYGVEWSRGLTEVQEHEYPEGEVECSEFINKPVTTFEWVPV